VLIDGPGRDKWVLSVGKDGILWKHDRKSGAYLEHVETVFQNVWASFDREKGTPRYRQDGTDANVPHWADPSPSPPPPPNRPAKTRRGQRVAPCGGAAGGGGRGLPSRGGGGAGAGGGPAATTRCRARTAWSASSARSTSTPSRRRGRCSSVRRS